MELGKPAILRRDCGTVDMNEANRIRPEFFLRLCIARDIWRPADAMTIQAPME